MTGSGKAFTRIELLIVVVAFCILLFLARACMIHEREKALRIRCVNNIKYAVVGLKMFKEDYFIPFPYDPYRPRTLSTPHASITLSNMTRSDIDQHAVWAHWGMLSNELDSPKILICPGHRAKRYSRAFEWTTGEAGFFNQRGYDRMHEFDHSHDRVDHRPTVGYDISVDYFISLDADETIPEGVLTGDANLNWTPIRPDAPFAENPAMAGVQVLENTNHFDQVRFTDGRGPPSSYRHHLGNGGNIGFTDGSVGQLNSQQLQQVFRAATNAHATNSLRLVIPQ